MNWPLPTFHWKVSAPLSNPLTLAEGLRATAAYVEAYKKMVESGGECLRTHPTGALPPPGSIFDPHSINKAVALELARLQEPVLGEPETNRIPGSAMATSHYNPNAIKPLIENVLDSNAHALKAAKKLYLPIVTDPG